MKRRVREAQYQALRAVNKEMITLYWDIGHLIAERQAGRTWGKAVVERLASDLRLEFPGVRGFSVQNLWYMRQFFLAYLAALDEKVRLPDENPSIGMILCKEKKRMIVEYALRDARKPIGVATYRTVKKLPRELKGLLPSPAEILKLLEGMDDF